MKKVIIALLLGIILIAGCEKEDYILQEVVGKWQLVGGYDVMMGGLYIPPTEEQRIVEYTKNNEFVNYDYLQKEIGRCNFRLTESTITIYGVEINGQKWESSYKYWIRNDTLQIHNDGGFESYEEFFKRIE
jgi:hypothetical protein